jgi:hypothetical protein
VIIAYAGIVRHTGERSWADDDAMMDHLVDEEGGLVMLLLLLLTMLTMLSDDDDENGDDDDVDDNVPSNSGAALALPAPESAQPASQPCRRLRWGWACC